MPSFIISHSFVGEQFGQGLAWEFCSTWCLLTGSTWWHPASNWVCLEGPSVYLPETLVGMSWEANLSLIPLPFSIVLIPLFYGLYSRVVRLLTGGHGALRGQGRSCQSS